MGRRSTGGTTPKQHLIEFWDSEASAKTIQDEVKGAGPDKLVRHQSILETEKSYNSTWWTQYTVLVHRSLKNSRSAIFTTMNLIKGTSPRRSLLCIAFICCAQHLTHIVFVPYKITQLCSWRYWFDVWFALVSDAVHRIDCV